MHDDVAMKAADQEKQQQGEMMSEKVMSNTTSYKPMISIQPADNPPTITVEPPKTAPS